MIYIRFTHTRYETELLEAKQNNKRFRKAAPLNDSGEQRYDHLLRSSGISDNDGQPSQQMSYSPAEFVTVLPSSSQIYSQPQQQQIQTFPHQPLQQIQTFPQPLQQQNQAFPQQQQTFQNVSQSPQQQTQKYSPNQYAYQMMTQDSTLSIQRSTTPVESSTHTMIIEGENYRIIDEKPIHERLLALETLMTKLGEKFENLIKAVADRSTHEDRLAEKIENFHRDFQAWKEIVNEDAFSTEFPLPLKKTDDVEVLEKKLASDNAFRIVMVNIYIYY